MKFAVFLAFGLSVVFISDISAAKSDDLLELCEAEFGRRYPQFKRRWVHGYYSHPRHHYRILKKPAIPSSCDDVKCPDGEACHLIKPKCRVDSCPLVPICVKKDQSGEWIDSEEWDGDGDELDQVKNSPASTHRNDIKQKPKDMEAAASVTGFVNAGGFSVPVEDSAVYNPTPIDVAGVQGGYVNPGGFLITPEAWNINNFNVPYGSFVDPGGFLVPVENAAIYNPAPIDAAGTQWGYVNPGGSLIPAGAGNIDSFNVPYESYVNPGGSLTPANSVSDNNANLFVDSLNLNNPVTFGASGSTDNFGTGETREIQYNPYFNIQSIPGSGVNAEGYKTNKRHRAGHKRLPFASRA